MSVSDLAAALDISPSYVSQLEHNARPLTMPVLLKLTERFGVDAEFFSPRDTARLIADVREVFADSSVGGAISAAELDQLTANLPGVAHVLVGLHRRYREANENIAALVSEQGLDRTSAQQPHEEIRDYFYQRNNHIPELDLPAEQLAAELRISPGQAHTALIAGLAKRHCIEVTTTGSGAEQHS